MKGKKCSSNSNSNADHGMRYIEVCENGGLNKNPFLQSLNRTESSQNTLKRMKEDKQYTHKHPSETQGSIRVQSYVSHEARKELIAQAENKTSQVKQNDLITLTLQSQQILTSVNILQERYQKSLRNYKIKAIPPNYQVHKSL